MRPTPPGWTSTDDPHATVAEEVTTGDGSSPAEVDEDGAATPALRNGTYSNLHGATNGNGVHRPAPRKLAVFCFEDPAGPIGQYVARTVAALAERGTPVHVFSRRPFDFFHPQVYVHAVGECPGHSLLSQVEEFTRRACNDFQRHFRADDDQVTLLAHEWSTIPAVSLLRSSRGLPALLSLTSMERQRSDLRSEESRRIDEIEVAGLREAASVLVHDGKTGEMARTLLPEAAPRLVPAQWTFPAHEFETRIDPGAIKARHAIGPIDPTILFIGDMDERHGPDVLMKAVAPVLKNHQQARFVFVGDGSLFWPMKVHARYLLLEHAVRFAGDVQGQDLRELVAAADIVAVPSREQTEWWPILAGWAAQRPVLTTHAMAGALQLHHEQDSVLTYPNPSSCVWGIERLLFAPELARAIGVQGRRGLEERFGWAAVAAQLQALMNHVVAR